MTIFLIKTEEVWLKDLYGQEYIEKIIASIPTMHKLQSTYFDLDRELSGKYADLQIYHEAEAIGY